MSDVNLIGGNFWNLHTKGNGGAIAVISETDTVVRHKFTCKFSRFDLISATIGGSVYVSN